MEKTLPVAWLDENSSYTSATTGRESVFYCLVQRPVEQG